MAQVDLCFNKGWRLCGTGFDEGVSLELGSKKGTVLGNGVGVDDGMTLGFDDGVTRNGALLWRWYGVRHSAGF